MDAFLVGNWAIERATASRQGCGAMISGDLRRILHDLGHVHAQLALPVGRRLRAEFGLSVVLFELLTAIADMPGCRVHDLAAELGVSTGGVSKLVDRLEAAGLCRRLPNPSDRRSSLVELTSAGAQACAGAMQAVDEELHGRLAGSLSAAQVSELAMALRALRSAGPQPHW
jgi:MarR family transcriptional regulator, organic hydroperoxide resistance regulator